MNLKPCTYCGVVATTVDHTVPQTLLKAAGDSGLDLSGISRITHWTVPACQQCNSILGDRVFKTMCERREFVKQRLKEKLGKYLRMPNWSEDEIRELGPNMQREVRLGLAQRDLARKRISWTGGTAEFRGDRVAWELHRTLHKIGAR